MEPVSFSARILRRLAGLCPIKGFDEKFYKNFYRDLAHVGGSFRLRHHFHHRGKKEGRFPNEKSLRDLVERTLGENADFNLTAYKYYNPDLSTAFDQDYQFIVHYARHGKGESRRCSFATEQFAGDTTAPAPLNLWEAIFSPSQALAWFGDDLDLLPPDRQALLKTFRQHGVNRLWPIEFGLMFDPAFYRTIARLDNAARLSDAELYRHWLQVGLENGVAPNPQAHLFAYLGETPFPAQFDWQGYARHNGMTKSLSKYDIIKTIFDARTVKPANLLPFFRSDSNHLLMRLGRHAVHHGNFLKAISAFTEIEPGFHDANTLCLLGDAYRGAGKASDALACYRRSIDAGGASPWSYSHAIDILQAAGDFSTAGAYLIRMKDHWGHKIEFQRKVDDCVASLFQRASASAHALYRVDTASDDPGALRSQADAIMTQALDRIKALYQACENWPAPTGGSPGGHIAFLANDDLRQCTHYRIDQKIEQFAAAGIPIQFFPHRDVRSFVAGLVGARAAIFYRVAATPEILRAILHAKAMGLPTYYEIDDLIFDSDYYPDPLATFEGQISPDEYSGLKFGVPLFRYALAQCDHIIASTSALARQMQRFGAKQSVLVVRNALDSRNGMAIALGRQPRTGGADGRIRIFYGSGTKAHNADFNDLVGPAVIAIMQDHDNVDLVIVGHLKLAPELTALDDRIKIYPLIEDLNTYWALLGTCDINLAVLHPGPVADCKSEIKWLEAAVLRIPSVMSDTASHAEVIAHGVDGLLAAGPADWLRHIRALVRDGSMRQRLGAAARAKALRRYSIETSTAIWRRAFPTPSTDANLPLPRRKLRILICNVFFHPQSIGGATRVVEDNVRNLLQLTDDIAIAVFCSNEGDPDAGHMQMGHCGQVPVYRMATSIAEGMDWRPFNDANKPLFERALDDFQPDIIHFHCIQRLTASIVEVAASRRIPYIVTLHDGWWISDHQFLVDADGFRRLPTTDLLADSTYSRHPLRSIERRQRLRTLLDGATARLSVSAPFARIYADAGIADVTVIENGVPDLTPGTRRLRDDGRVALGHIGGRAAHKGAFLIEAALRQGDYRHLHLTMIDGTLPAGQSVETTWGSTPVTLCGPHPQQAIAQLYAQLDVLLAPSTWPESYGLVTREALSLGLWVVASDQGAIGQGITHGENGYVIDTTTGRALKAVFSTLDRHPARYRGSPPPGHQPPRRMADQARDLYELYTALFTGGAVTADDTGCAVARDSATGEMHDAIA